MIRRLFFTLDSPRKVDHSMLQLRQPTETPFSTRNCKVLHYLRNSLCSPTSNCYTYVQGRANPLSEEDSLSLGSNLSLSSSLSDRRTDSSANSSTESSSFSEELDFNLGFDHTADDQDDEEEYFRQLSGATLCVDETIAFHRGTEFRHAPFLHDSTYTLCSQDRFSAYTDNQAHVDETRSTGVRSNSLSTLQLNAKTAFVDIPPKKVVHFADTLVRSRLKLNSAREKRV